MDDATLMLRRRCTAACRSSEATALIKHKSLFNPKRPFEFADISGRRQEVAETRNNRISEQTIHNLYLPKIGEDGCNALKINLLNILNSVYWFMFRKGKYNSKNRENKFFCKKMKKFFIRRLRFARWHTNRGKNTIVTTTVH